ncbi:hypothetical protein HC891_11455 [Candidatus Gracilibacteria bacterium]|nr:hypothetical protein [Candidatus Gracilibacteria bacterium]
MSLIDWPAMPKKKTESEGSFLSFAAWREGRLPHYQPSLGELARDWSEDLGDAAKQYLAEFPERFKSRIN